MGALGPIIWGWPAYCFIAAPVSLLAAWYVLERRSAMAFQEAQKRAVEPVWHPRPLGRGPTGKA